MERGCRPEVGRWGEGVGYWGAVAHIIASVRDERQLALLPLLRQPRWRRHKRREQVSTVQRVPVQPFEKRRFRNVRALPHGHHRAVCGHRVEEGSEEGSGPCHRRRAALLAVEGGDHGGRQGDAPTGHVSDRREPPRVAVAGAKQGFFAVGEGSEHLPRGMRCVVCVGEGGSERASEPVSRSATHSVACTPVSEGVSEGGRRARRRRRGE